MEEIIYPVRINKYLAARKICTRRKADELIAAGKVLINGKVAQLGAKVLAADKVSVDEKTAKKMAKEYVYLAYNKAIGVMTHGGAVEHKKDIGAILDFSPKVFPVGRLDEDSHGLIILTNDGRVTDRLLSPKYNHEKEYIVKVNKPLAGHFFTQMAKGVKIEEGAVLSARQSFATAESLPNGITKPAEVDGAVGAKTFKIILTEGKRHQLRRMYAVLGYEVVDLERTRVINIKLAGLKLGGHRKLEGAELKTFLKGIGL